MTGFRRDRFFWYFVYLLSYSDQKNSALNLVLHLVFSIVICHTYTETIIKCEKHYQLTSTAEWECRFLGVGGEMRVKSRAFCGAVVRGRFLSPSSWLSRANFKLLTQKCTSLSTFPSSFRWKQLHVFYYIQAPKNTCARLWRKSCI